MLFKVKMSLEGKAAIIQLLNHHFRRLSEVTFRLFSTVRWHQKIRDAIGPGRFHPGTREIWCLPVPVLYLYRLIRDKL